MSDHRKIPTSVEVYAVIRAKHGDDLALFSSYSNPTGSDGMTTQPQMHTEWGFLGDEFPVIGAATYFDIGENGKRENVTSAYWLCVGLKEDDY